MGPIVGCIAILNIYKENSKTYCQHHTPPTNRPPQLIAITGGHSCGGVWYVNGQ